MLSSNNLVCKHLYKLNNKGSWTIPMNFVFIVDLDWALPQWNKLLAKQSFECSKCNAFFGPLDLKPLWLVPTRWSIVDVRVYFHKNSFKKCVLCLKLCTSSENIKE